MRDIMHLDDDSSGAKGAAAAERLRAMSAILKHSGPSLH
jgi:hypothetical protein